jgi:DUF4097 and DUF4098 domain-containing protein YvlB
MEIDVRKSLLLLPLLFPLTTLANECQFEAGRDFQIDPAGLRALAAELGSSNLHAEGVAGLTHIEVHGRACASEQAWLNDLDVTQKRDGDRVVLTPTHPQRNNSFGLFYSSYAYIDLHVRMPTNLLLDIQSGSGDAVVRDLAALNFSAGSGDLSAKNVAGPMLVKVNSGDVQASDIGGLEVTSTGSGDISVGQVHGDIKVGHVGSGDLEFSDVSGGLRVEKIGSGNLDANRIKGDVSIGAIGSGDVHVDGVGGNFSVAAKGSGDIHQQNVSGRVDVPRARDR